MNDLVLSNHEFHQFQAFMYEVTGIHLTEAKHALVSGRLAGRIRQLGMSSYGTYFNYALCDDDERQLTVDLLTTNETFFFREHRHFHVLKERLRTLAHDGASFRVWSAACSSGEEAYSIAMVLADNLGTRPWEVTASDISRRVLNTARAGQYTIDAAKHIPQRFLTRYCLKGVNQKAGTFAISPELRRSMRFTRVNLNAPLPVLGSFDIIFLRNVMIYFDRDTKQGVLDRLLSTLRPGGLLFISHAENLLGISHTLRMVAPAVYCKAET